LTISNAGAFVIGSTTAGASFLNGELDGIGVFDLLLTAAEIKANVPFKYLGASQTAITAGNFIVGKEYRIVTVGDTDFTAIGASANTIGVEFTATGVGGGTTGEATQIGQVASYEPEGIENNQWKDASGNDLNGDVSGAIPINSWNRTESVKYIVDGSKTFTLPKDFIITNVMYENASGSPGDLEIGWTASSNEIINKTSIVTGTINSIHATVGKKVNADDVIYITTTQEMTVKVLMERV
jgi:hypothetical protein